MKNKIIVLNEKGEDITNSVIIINGLEDPLYYKKMADNMFEKAERFYEKELSGKGLELSNEEWFQKFTHYNKIADIASELEDKELAARFRTIIDFIALRDENPILAKSKLNLAFNLYLSKMPTVAANL